MRVKKFDMLKNEILKEQAKSLKFGNLVCKKLKITKKLQKKITKVLTF